MKTSESCCLQPLHCLTIRQPWATCIVEGPKRWENRSWRREVPDGGLFLALHAGLARTRLLEWNTAHEKWPGLAESKTPTGAILGIARIDRIVPVEGANGDPWAFGPWCWHIDSVWKLSTPYLWRGHQGLREIPVEVAQEIWEMAK